MSQSAGVDIYSISPGEGAPFHLLFANSGDANTKHELNVGGQTAHWTGHATVIQTPTPSK